MLKSEATIYICKENKMNNSKLQLSWDCQVKPLNSLVQRLAFTAPLTLIYVWEKWHFLFSQLTPTWADYTEENVPRSVLPVDNEWKKVASDKEVYLNPFTLSCICSTKGSQEWHHMSLDKQTQPSIVTLPADHRPDGTDESGTEDWELPVA